jgi:hypothetical protein
MPQIQILVDPRDMSNFMGFLQRMQDGMGRAEIIPILKEHFEPVVAAEKRNLADHVKSGALSGSLQARSGGGDRPGVVSVFSAPTMTRAKLIKAWSGGRAQQQGWAARMKKRGRRRRVFYDVMVEAGHRQVKRIDGVLKEIGSPVPGIFFAKKAMMEVGKPQAEAAAEAIMDHIMGINNGR